VRSIPEIPSFFGCGSAHFRNLRNLPQQQSPLYRHFWVCHKQRRDPSYVTGDMIHLAYYRKQTKSLYLTFGLEPPMCRSKSNWTHQCISCHNRFLPNFIQISRHKFQKILFFHVLRPPINAKSLKYVWIMQSVRFIAPRMIYLERNGDWPLRR